MDAPFVGISSAGANRFNLTFPGISGEYPLITERTEYGVKVKEMLGTAGWDGDAGLVWFRTIKNQLTREQSFNQSDSDPSYFWKRT